MTVNAQTAREVRAVEVRFDTEPRRGRSGDYAYTATGSAHQIEGLADGRWVHWIDLGGLEPGRRYWFVVGSEEHGFSRERAFETLPDDDSPIRFVAGGDLGLGSDVRQLHAHAAARKPQFAIIGGDLAYVNGELSDVEDWDEWFDQWEDGMVTPDGLTVPMVLSVGNHEVRGGYLGGTERAPFYTGFFAQPTSTDRPSYFRTRFGALMALYTLDTGHIVSHESQVGWLEEALTGDAGVPYRFAQYHIPMYPSHREYEAESMRLAREHWLPLFDRHGLTAAFENHDHTFKRTHPLRGGQVAGTAGGTVYFGDGAWGRGDRPVRLSERWYLAASGANRHFWIVDVRPDGVEYRAVDTRGGVFHVYPSDLPDAVAAEAYFRTLPQQWELRAGSLDVVPGGGGMEITLKNLEDYPLIATLSAVGPDGAPRGTVEGDDTAELDPGETMTRRIELGAGAGNEPVQVVGDLDVETPRGRVYARLARTIGFDAPLDLSSPGDAGPAVTLDGRTEEWARWPWQITTPSLTEEGWPTQWTGEGDASASIALRVQGDALVVAVEVTDDVVVPNDGDDWEGGDGLLLWLDGLPDGEFDDDPYLGVPLTSTGGEVPVLVTDGDWVRIAGGSRAWTARTPGGWSAEVSVPLELVGGAAPGSTVPDEVRLNVGIVDVDAPGGSAAVILRRPEWELDWDYPESGRIILRRPGS
jgi:hypothetical protein